jgi:ferredoxin, 2Fe-2S
MTAEVSIEPLGVRFPVATGENVMAAATRAGLRWPTLCRGNAQCGFCFAEIVASSHDLPPVEAREARALKLSPRPREAGEIRLACQLCPTGDIVLRRAGVLAQETIA